MIEIICDRDTCGNVVCIGNESSANVTLSSADDFITNLLHLKCKVVQLVRRQMQKEIPGVNDSNYGTAYLRSARRTRALEPQQTPPEVSVESLVRNVTTRSPPSDNSREESALLASMPERPAVNAHADPDNLHISDQTSNARPRTENLANSSIQWLKSTLASWLPFYWIIVAIGILAFACLVCGVLLGAFICTNGTSGFPFFFWQRSRVVHAFY